MSKHTPGPWNVDETVGQTIEISTNSETVICDLVGLSGEGEVNANARLIAAAPDLLTELAAMVTRFVERAELANALAGGPPEMLRQYIAEATAKARALIAKAEGR